MKKKYKKESEFQHDVIEELESMFPGCIPIILDPNYIQGMPDLSIFYNDKWATLECKISVNASRQPNQEHYVKLMNEMSFSRFIYPENADEVFNELKQYFGGTNEI